MSTQEAYRIVVKDIIENGSPVFMGKYDVEHGHKSFMFGILALMVYIADKADDDLCSFVTSEFIQNMIDSER